MLYYRMEYVQSGRTFKTSAKTMEKLDEYIHGCLRCGNRIKEIEAVNLIDEIKNAFAPLTCRDSNFCGMNLFSVLLKLKVKMNAFLSFNILFRFFVLICLWKYPP